MSSIETEVVPVHVTSQAVARVKDLIAKQGKPNLHLRVGVKGGGCSGLSYMMTLEEEIKPSDICYTQDGVLVVVDPKSAKFLSGVVLDYTLGNLLEGGWKWTNPNAQRSCGCGTSFTPK